MNKEKQYQQYALRLEQQLLQRQDFSSYIEAVLRPMCQVKKQKLIYMIDLPTDYYTFNDKLRVAQIAYNLFNNASKFTPEGSTIKCSVTGKLLPGNQKMAVHTEISDNGIGMSESFQKVIFDTFTQEQRDDNNIHRGSGLGMSIVKQLVDLLGGHIEVASALGKGTTFKVTFTLPQLKNYTPPPVEENPDWRQQVLAVPGAAAIPIIAMTGDVDRDTAKACLAAGMNKVLTKPLNRDELLQALLQLLRD